MENQHHEMLLEMTHASGMQGWYCPTCGRRLLLYVPPNNAMLIVEAGDPYANHSGSMGGLRVSAVQIKEEDGEVSEKSLRPWIKALENLNLDW